MCGGSDSARDTGTAGRMHECGSSQGASGSYTPKRKIFWPLTPAEEQDRLRRKDMLHTIASDSRTSEESRAFALSLLAIEKAIYEMRSN